MDLKDIKKNFRKVDASDYRVLVAGVVALIIPVFFLYLFISGNNKQNRNFERMHALKDRKTVFKLPSTAATQGKSTRMNFDSNRKSAGMLVETEFKDAISRIMNNPTPRLPDFGLSLEQRQIQDAMVDRNLAAGNSHFDMGNYKDAEVAFIKAFENAGDNNFLKVEAMGALVGLYEQQNDHEKLLKAFDKYMEYMAKLPPGFGGDLRPFLTNMKDSMILMKARVTPSQIDKYTQGLSSSDDTSLQSALNSPDQLLKMIPVRFE